MTSTTTNTQTLVQWLACCRARVPQAWSWSSPSRSLTWRRRWHPRLLPKPTASTANTRIDHSTPTPIAVTLTTHKRTSIDSTLKVKVSSSSSPNLRIVRIIRILRMAVTAKVRVLMERARAALLVARSNQRSDSYSCRLCWDHMRKTGKRSWSTRARPTSNFRYGKLQWAQLSKALCKCNRTNLQPTANIQTFSAN